MAMLQFYKNWTEFFFFIVMIIGLFVALAAPSAVVSYAIVFLCGTIAGRLIYEVKDGIKLPYLIIIAGFVLGYLIGVYYGSRTIVIALFVISSILTYKLYEKGILKDTRF